MMVKGIDDYERQTKTHNIQFDIFYLHLLSLNIYITLELTLIFEINNKITL